jgi:hypothetical protein
MPSFDCLAHFFSWMRFRYRHELDFTWRTIGFHSCLRDLLTNPLKILGNAH